jgi:hypothetical protein
MECPRVRAVVTTKSGCKERTAWYRGITSEAIDAVNALVRRQRDDFSLNWEQWGDNQLPKPWRPQSVIIRACTSPASQQLQR